MKKVKGKEIQRYVKNDAYQVFILDTPVSFPLWLFRHTYIVVNDHGTLTRWDIFHRNYGTRESQDYLHKNFTDPWQGLGIFYIPICSKKPHFKARLLGMIEGGKDSQACKVVQYINSQVYNYPFVSRYNMVLGPNSNTFTQWALDQCNTPNITLPALAHGKGFKEKRYRIT